MKGMGLWKQTGDVLAAVRELCDRRSFIKAANNSTSVYCVPALCWELEAAVNKAKSVVSRSSLPSREDRQHISNAVLGVGTRSQGSLQEGNLVQSAGLGRFLREVTLRRYLNELARQRGGGKR